MKEEEKKAKALENEKVQSSKNVNSEKEEEIISDNDAEKLEGGVKSVTDFENSDGVDSIAGLAVCCIG